MELEMKYSIGNKDIAESIWADEYLKTIEEDNTREKVFMKAAYFDTHDHILCHNDITFRVRMENDRIIATLKLSGENELHSIIETRFLRSRFRVDTGNTIIEVSIDKGEIITEKGEEPILEMELEMFSGNEEELVKIGEEISEKYGLQAEERSKYARGKNMLLGEK